MSGPGEEPTGATVLHTCLEPAVEGSAARVHCEEIAAGLRRRGLRVVPVWNTFRTRGRLGGWLRHWQRVAASLPRAEAVYSRWHVMDLPTCLLARWHGRRLVLEVNGGLGDQWAAPPLSRALAPVFRLLAQAELRLADEVVCVSPGLQDWVRSLVPGHVGVRHAPNGTNPTLAARAGPASRPAYACFVGVLAPWQGLDLLLAAAASPRWPEGVGLEIVGDGRSAASLRVAAGHLPHVTFHGKIPRERTLQILAGSSVSLCLPGSHLARNQVNGIPFKLLESLALGVPVVVSPLAHQVEAVRRVDGGLATGETPGEVAAAVADVVRRCQTEQRVALAHRSARELSWERAVDEAEAALTPSVRGRVDPARQRWSWPG